MFNINNSSTRILDLGCGPADIFRFIGNQEKPSYYYGLDISDEYINDATSLLKKENIDHTVEIIDLTKIGMDINIDAKIRKIVADNKLNTVLLIGVLHHLPTEAINNTLSLLFSCESIKNIYTEDIVRNMNPINDFFVKLDRGEFVRETDEYVNLLEKTDWKIAKQFWTTAGLSSIKYIHFQLSK
jgi:SAM-dependent methyltransferase